MFVEKMRKAVLVGFRYEGDKKLPGIVVDLYQIYIFLKENGWKEEDIYVLTDVKGDQDTNVLRKAILEKIVDTNILSFISLLKKNNRYIRYKTYSHSNNFTSIFIKDGTGPQNLFFYYSGHSKDNCFVLPSDALVSFNTFLDLTYDEVFIILDCCEGDLGLTYQCFDNFYRFRNEKFFAKHILAFSSSLDNEKSLTDAAGSLFTKNIVKTLRKRSSVYKILQESKNSQKQQRQNVKQKDFKATINISASYPLEYVFSWVYKDVYLTLLRSPYYVRML